jgi:tetratricopeptide (TPR) repeat protein
VPPMRPTTYKARHLIDHALCRLKTGALSARHNKQPATSWQHRPRRCGHALAAMSPRPSLPKAFTVIGGAHLLQGPPIEFRLAVLHRSPKQPSMAHLEVEGMSDGHVKPLRIADEAFLIASTIERCPKTMMLRELVMNGLEAARDGDAPKRVELRPVIIGGARKLGIWNTGRGLSPLELDHICDLASTLRKTSGLDGNFGMGAKVASLPSNKHGMRFRSCRDGRVSEVMLAQREGVYGRLPFSDGTPMATPGVADATEAARGDGHDLSRDWTEVVLFGQTATQDTTADPYAGNPGSIPQWLMTNLTRRFFRLPQGLALTLAAGLGSDGPQHFLPLGERAGEFDRSESVPTRAGIVLHFGFTSRAGPAVDSGCGMIVFGDEIYGRVDGTKWLFDAPVFGFPFAARNCRVVVELPPSFGVRPEAYRQFLRFREGDQRQVFLTDYAGLVRTSIPAWLRDIIASFGPARPDYLAEIRTELADLLAELGVAPSHRADDHVRGLEPEKQPDIPETPEAEKKEPEPPALPKKRVETPPTIISLRDEAEIADKGLTGRAAIYHPATHELFVNLHYPAVEGAKAHLRHALGPVPDPEAADALAAEMAETLITRKVARAAVFGLAKKAAGWTPEEVSRAQSAEALSLAADDFHALLPGAQRQLAEGLGLSVAEALADNKTAAAARQLATTIAEAKQAAQRSAGERRSAGFKRRVSELEFSRGNMPEAATWAWRAVEANPEDPYSHRQLADIALRSGKHDEAGEHAAEALRLGVERGDLPGAIGHFGQAAAAAKGDRAGLLIHLSHLQWEAGQQMAAQASVDEAEQAEGRTSRVLRRYGDMAMSRGDFDGAIGFAQDALTADPGEPAPYLLLTAAYMRKGNLVVAGDAARRALEMQPARPVPYLRAAADVALHVPDYAAAAAFVDAAIAADPADPGPMFQRSILLQRTGDLPGARAAATVALSLAPNRPTYLLRRLGELAREAGQIDEARDWFERALERGPSEPVNYIILSELHQRAGDLDRAWTTTAAGLDRTSVPNAALLRRAAQVAATRQDLPTALCCANDAVALEPREPWNHHILSEMLQRSGDIAGALAAQKLAVLLAAPGAQQFRSRLHQIGKIVDTRTHTVDAAE